MPWVKLTDDFTEHRKLLEAGPLAGWLWIAGLAWSNRNGTDGRIPLQVVSRLAAFDGVGVYTGTYSGEDVDVRNLAVVLVNVGLWEEVEGGFYIHDYSDYQLTTDQLAELREKKVAAGRAGGKARASALAKAGDEAESKPDPRIPLPDSSLSSANGFNRELPQGLWMMVAEEKLKAQKPGSVTTPERWLLTTASNAEKQQTERAHQLLEEYDVSSSQLAAALAVGKVPPSWNPYRRPA
jgi:hypothetical protein